MNLFQNAGELFKIPEPKDSIGFLNKSHNIFSTQEFVLLPARYGSVLGIDSYCYFQVEKHDASDANVDCTLLRDGEPIEGHVIQVPKSVIDQSKVRQGETVCRIGERMYQYCLVRHDGVYQYGQIVSTSWEQNTVFETVHSRAKVHVQLPFLDNSICTIRACDALECSELMFLSRLFESTTDATKEFKTIHNELEKTLRQVLPDQYVEFFLQHGKTVDDIHWTQGVAVKSRWGNQTTLLLEEVINAMRLERGLSLWTSVSSKARMIQDQYQERTAEIPPLEVQNPTEVVSNLIVGAFEQLKETLKPLEPTQVDPGTPIQDPPPMVQKPPVEPLKVTQPPVYVFSTVKDEVSYDNATDVFANYKPQVEEEEEEDVTMDLIPTTPPPSTKPLLDFAKDLLIAPTTPPPPSDEFELIPVQNEHLPTAPVRNLRQPTEAA